MDVTLRQIKEEELSNIIDFFNEEGWNVNIKSVRALYRYQPEAFTVAVTADGKVVGNIMGYTINERFAFGTGFIVSKPHRRQGIGKKLWQWRWDKMAAMTFGVDAALRRLEPNQNLGFGKPECVVTVYSGTPIVDPHIASFRKRMTNIELKELDDSLFPSLVTYDGKMNHSGEREDYLRGWFAMEDLHCVVAAENGKIVGCGEIHPAEKGHMFGHLYADTNHIASLMMIYLIDKIGWGGPVGLCSPDLNNGCQELLKTFGLKGIFTAYRMWTKPLQKDLPYQHIYAFPEIAP